LVAANDLWLKIRDYQLSKLSRAAVTYLYYGFLSFSAAGQTSIVTSEFQFRISIKMKYKKSLIRNYSPSVIC